MPDSPQYALFGSMNLVELALMVVKESKGVIILGIYSIPITSSFIKGKEY